MSKTTINTPTVLDPHGVSRVARMSEDGDGGQFAGYAGAVAFFWALAVAVSGIQVPDGGKATRHMRYSEGERKPPKRRTRHDHNVATMKALGLI